MTWDDFAKGLSPSLPDSAYDALREKFYNETVRPEILRAGQSDTLAKQDFMERTARAGKSPLPRLGVAAASALEAAAAPLKPILPYSAQKAAEIKAGAVAEAQRQEVGTALPEFVGANAGLLPYFALGMPPALQAARAVGLGARIATVAAGAAVSGAYDAAKAEDGHRIVEGLKGAGMGGAFFAAFEGAGALRAFLRKGAGLSETQAADLEAVLKGFATPEQEVSASAAASNPAVGKAVEIATQQEASAGKAVGMPAKPARSAPRKNLRLTLIYPDGKEWHAGGAVGYPEEMFPKLADRVVDILKQGGQIGQPVGDPEKITKFFKLIQERTMGQEQIPLSLKSITGEQAEPVADIPLNAHNGSLPFAPAERVEAPIEYEAPIEAPTKATIQPPLAPKGRALRPPVPSVASTAATEGLTAGSNQLFADALKQGTVSDVAQLLATGKSDREVIASLRGKIAGDDLDHSVLVSTIHDRLGIPDQEDEGFAKWAESYLAKMGARSTATGVSAESGVVAPTPPTPKTSGPPVESLVSNLRKILEDPSVSAADKRTSRLRLKRLAPDVLAEIDAKQAALSQSAATPSAVSAQTPTPPTEGPSAELAAAQERSRQLAAQKGQIDINQNVLSDRLEVLPSGMVRDRINGRVYNSISDALEGTGRFSIEGRLPIDELINDRDTLYHTTTFSGLKNILLDREIRPGKELGEVSLSRVPSPLQSAEYHDQWAEGPHYFESPVTIVLDRSKLPPTTPIAEKPFGVKSLEQYGMNPLYASEERVAGAIPLEAIKGVIVNLAEHRPYDISERRAFGTLDAKLVAMLRHYNIPIDTADNWRDLALRRAEMGRSGAKFSIDEPTGRRGFLQRLVGGALSARQVPKAGIEGVAKAAGMGNDVAKRMLGDMISASYGWDLGRVNIDSIKGKIIRFTTEYGENYVRSTDTLLSQVAGEISSFAHTALRSLEDVIKLKDKSAISTLTKELNEHAGGLLAQVARSNLSGIEGTSEFFSPSEIDFLKKLAPNIVEAADALALKFESDPELTPFITSSLIQRESSPVRSLKDITVENVNVAVKSVLEGKGYAGERWIEHQRRLEEENNLLREEAKQSRTEKIEEQYQEQLQQARPTGMELARTHLPIGEEGQGGILTRYSLADKWKDLKQRLSDVQLISKIPDELVPVVRNLQKGRGTILDTYLQLVNKGKMNPDDVATILRPYEAYKGELFDKLSGADVPAMKNAALRALDDFRAGKIPLSEAFSHLQNLGITAPEAVHQLRTDPWIWNVVSDFKEKKVSIQDALKKLMDGGLTPGEAYENLQPYIPKGQEQSTGLRGTPPSLFDPNLPQPKITERPLYTRVIGGVEAPVGYRARAVTFGEPGQKPTIRFNPGRYDESTLVHELHHAFLGNLDLTSTIDSLLRNDPTNFAQKLLGAFTPRWREFYKNSWPEELWVNMATAVRTGNQDLLQAAADADGGRATVLNWFSTVADQLRSKTMELPDSLHKRIFEGKLNDLVRRSTGELDRIAREIEVLGDELRWEGGKFVLEAKDGTKYSFNSRDELLREVEAKYTEPLNAPNLIDESNIPPGTPRYAADITPNNLSRAPIQTVPPSPEVTPSSAAPSRGRVRGGLSALSFPFRPFYPWLQTVADKAQWPGLYDAFKRLDDGLNEMELFARKWEKPLAEVFLTKKGGVSSWKYSPSRRQDLYRYMEAPAEQKAAFEQEFHITAAEKADLESLRRNFYDPLFATFGIDPELYIQEYAPRLRQSNFDPDAIRPSGRLTKDVIDFFAEHVRTGDLDPRDQDLLRVSHVYLRAGAKKLYLGEPLKTAAKLVDLKTSDGSFVLGTLQPLLKRHLDFVRGVPDYSQRVVDGAVNTIIETISDGIKKLNSKLPGALKLESLEKKFDDLDARDALGKWTLFSYAGGLGLRPMVPIRDSLQLFLTAYPMLGEHYLAVGMKKAMAERSVMHELAQQYGALVSHSDLSNLWTSEYAKLGQSKLTDAAELMLRPMRWGYNVNRTVAFSGYSEKVFDAIAQYRNDPEKLLQASGMLYFDSGLQKTFLQKIAQANPSEWRDISYKVAKELTELSDWNYRRGALPGIYQYGIGRLFGQYGTWPLNYIEYLRRLATKGSAKDKSIAMARITLAHGAALASAQAAGIDAGQWVFTQPMAYGGSPVFNAVINTPMSMDFESYKGAEARRQVIAPLTLGIPGSVAMGQVYKAITNNDPNLPLILLGFHPMTPKETNRPMHEWIPQ